MSMETLLSRSFDFHFPTLDTAVRVEHQQSQIVLRATRATFSPMRKRLFIRHLAAEGFIPDLYLQFSDFDEFPGISWSIDSNWLDLNPTGLARGKQVMIRLAASAAVLWVATMAFLLLN
jgi:hypothetical protein